MHSFAQEEILTIESRGSSVSDVLNQIGIFEKGFKHTKLVRPAIVGDGIFSLSEQEVQDLVEKYDAQKRYYSILKFVPASGAASRMFKHLFEYLNDGKENGQVAQFMSKVHLMALSPDLERETKGHLKTLLTEKKYDIVLKALLKKPGLNYGESPKGLIPFHRSGEKITTAFQEHLVEGAAYAWNGQDDVQIHFTISKEHQDKFKNHLKELIDQFEEDLGVKFKVDFSFQKISTDTIAVDSNNNPVKKSNGNFLFRPGGHGALIQNLNEIDADVIFIKNIDNVLPDNHRSDTIRYKKALSAKLIELQAQVFDFIEKLHLTTEDTEFLEQVQTFCITELNIDLMEEFQNLKIKDKRNQLLQLLNRPIRVCGMVKNTGEPGGGPFWIKNSDGTTSLQIVESAQVDMKDDGQKHILSKSTHFNPVDLVCGTKNYLGETFDLTQFIDQNSYFISEKSFVGQTIKALEHPGLWNGAMAGWITIFVEVPITTFSPVKTVNDLLKEEHLG